MEESNKFKPPAYQTALGGSTTLIRPILLARIGASDLGQHRKARRTPDSKDDMAHCKYADASEGCRVIETLEHAYTCTGRAAKKKALTDAIAEFVGQIQINREKHVNRTEPGEYPTGNDQDDRKIRERKERIQRETLEIAQLIPPEMWWPEANQNVQICLLLGAPPFRVWQTQLHIPTLLANRPKNYEDALHPLERGEWTQLLRMASKYWRKLGYKHTAFEYT